MPETDFFFKLTETGGITPVEKPLSLFIDMVITIDVRVEIHSQGSNIMTKF